jgi:hypothetical protein
MMLHSNIVGSSTAKRRLACPGSIDLEAAAPVPPESPYAAEGTALHSAMEYLLTEDDATLDQATGMTFYHHVISPERAALLDFCLKAFNGVVTPGTEYDVEKTYPFPRIPGAFGTGDIAYFASDRVGVVDWKFGGGVFIPAEDNAQMKFLLCGMREAERLDRSTRLFGTIVPGYKLVENAPRRKWGDEAQVERWLARQKIKAKDRRQTVLLSPAQMEKRFPTLKDKLQDFIVRPKPDLLLVPDGDKRPPVLLGDNLSAATAKVLDSVTGSVDDWG